jgi:hypothetical protein
MAPGVIFTPQLMNKPNKLKCFSLTSLPSQVYYNTLAFKAYNDENEEL